MADRFTTLDMIGELRRELALRERLYPAWVSKGTLQPAKAARQIALVKAAIARLEETMSYEEVRQSVLPRG